MQGTNAIDAQFVTCLNREVDQALKLETASLHVDVRLGRRCGAPFDRLCQANGRSPNPEGSNSSDGIAKRFPQHHHGDPDSDWPCQASNE
jgi:hypothetical protein